MSGIQVKGDGKNTIEIQQQKTVGDVHMVLLKLPGELLIKVTVIGHVAKAEVLNSEGERVW